MGQPARFARRLDNYMFLIKKSTGFDKNIKFEENVNFDNKIKFDEIVKLDEKYQI